MEYQTIKENGEVKFVVLPIKLFQALLDRLEDESDLLAIREAKSEPLYDQEEAENYIFMNSVKRERLDRGWTQQELARRLGVKQATVAKWERQGAVYRKKTREKLAKVFAVGEEVFLSWALVSIGLPRVFTYIHVELMKSSMESALSLQTPHCAWHVSLVPQQNSG